MKFTLTTTAAVFLAIVVIGVGGLAASGVMTVGTVLMMVLPSTLVFGLICLAIGVRHGEHRATG